MLYLPFPEGTTHQKPAHPRDIQMLSSVRHSAGIHWFYSTFFFTLYHTPVSLAATCHYTALLQTCFFFVSIGIQKRHTKKNKSCYEKNAVLSCTARATHVMSAGACSTLGLSYTFLTCFFHTQLNVIIWKLTALYCAHVLHKKGSTLWHKTQRSSEGHFIPTKHFYQSSSHSFNCLHLRELCRVRAVTVLRLLWS